MAWKLLVILVSNFKQTYSLNIIHVVCNDGMLTKNTVEVFGLTWLCFICIRGVQDVISVSAYLYWAVSQLWLLFQLMYWTECYHRPGDKGKQW